MTALPAISGGGPGANVVIVEDEFLVALQLEDILAEAGHRVIGIVPDHESVQAIAETPHIALVDLNLRDGPSGPSIAMALSQRFGTRIVYVTANPSQIERPAPTAIGVVQKPFSRHAILSAVACALHGHTQSAAPELRLFYKPGP